MQTKLSFDAPARKGTEGNPLVLDDDGSDGGEQGVSEVESDGADVPDYLEETSEAESSDEDQGQGVDAAESERREIERHVQLLYRGELVRSLPRMI